MKEIKKVYNNIYNKMNEVQRNFAVIVLIILLLLLLNGIFCE